MEIKVLKKPIEVLIGSDDKYGVKLRQPTYGELLDIQGSKTDLDIINGFDNLLIEFVNKPKLVDEDGEEVKYSTIQEFMDLTLSTELLIGLSNTIVKQLKERGKFSKK